MMKVTLSQLEQFGELAIRTPTPSRGVAKEADANVTGDWNSLLAGCAFAQSCSDPHNARRLPEPYWYALASLLSRCDGGLAIFHEISVQDVHRYDQADTEQKFVQAREASAPRTCRSIHEDLGFDGCRRCVFWGHA